MKNVFIDFLICDCRTEIIICKYLDEIWYGKKMGLCICCEKCYSLNLQLHELSTVPSEIKELFLDNVDVLYNIHKKERTLS